MKFRLRFHCDLNIRSESYFLNGVHFYFLQDTVDLNMYSKSFTFFGTYHLKHI